MNNLLSLLKKRIEENKGQYEVLTLKGFKNEVFSSIAKEVKAISNQSSIEKDNLIHPDKILKSKDEVLLKVNKATTKAPILLDYESFLFLSQHNNLDALEKRFLIIENNFIDEYPNQSNQSSSDFDELIEKGLPIPDDSSFHNFYSNASVSNGLIFIQFVDATLDMFSSVKKVELIEVKDLGEIDKIETGAIPLGSIRFQPNSYDYINVKLNLLDGAISSDLVFIVDEITKLQKEAKGALAKLISFIEQAEIPAKVFLTKENLNIDYRPELNEILNKYWKSKSFRNLELYSNPDKSNELVELSQGSVVEMVIRQFENGIQNEAEQKINPVKDVFLTAPTGAGKSLLFQMPAIYLAEKYDVVTIVISPLIALMKDQVRSMINDKDFKKVAYINSELSLVEREALIEKVHNGEISILYISPELLLSYELSMFLGKRKLGLFVIDEAHLVTTWGRDFRVDYWYLGNFIKRIRKYHPEYNFPVMAVTATAVYGGPNDMAFETLDSLAMENAIMYIGKIKRDDIAFEITPLEITGYHEKEKIELTAKRIGEFIEQGEKSIIYCPWTGQLTYIKDRLSAENKALTGIYYGGLGKEIKNEAYEQYRTNQLKSIISTKAFGMGVDIDDITTVYHHSPSGHLADYVQEIGRAARRTDLKGKAVMDFASQDLKFTRILYALSSIKPYQLQMVINKLSRMSELNNSQNLVVSVDDFQHIFDFANIDIEQKVKSALLLIEKDLQEKYKFNVIVARPQRLATTVFARINFDQQKQFEKQYGDFVKYIKHAKTEAKQQYVYSIELEKIWARDYSDKNFMLIKNQYFHKQLFLKDGLSVSPQLRINFHLNESAKETNIKLTKRFDEIDRVIHFFGEKYFDKAAFAKQLEAVSSNPQTAKRIADLIISVYASKYDTTGRTKGFVTRDSFMQQKKIGMGNKFRVFDRSYRTIRTENKNRFERMFGGMGDGFRNSTFYLPVNDEKNIGMIKIAYLLEAFDLATYEISGIEKPGICVRINDIEKLKQLAKGNYSNDILTEIDRRQQTSVSIMEYFFTQKLSTPERWNFIENYFLGTPVQELIGGELLLVEAEEEVPDED